MVLILGTGDPSKSLSENGTTKSYLVFILAFTAITNIVVRISLTSTIHTTADGRNLQRFFGSTLYLIARLITG